MKLSHPKAFVPFVNDTVTVYSVAQVAGRKACDERLCSVPCCVMTGAGVANGGAALASQNGRQVTVVIQGRAWDHAVPPQAETTKLESLEHGVLIAKTVDKLGDDWVLSCVEVGKAVRKS
jgi:hypothetical protein